MEFKRNLSFDLHVQRILLCAYRPSPSLDSIEVEHIDPKAVILISRLTQKEPREALMVLHALHMKYPTCPEHLIPEIDELIEGARQRAERAAHERRRTR